MIVMRILKPIDYKSQVCELPFWRKHSFGKCSGYVDCEFADGDTLTPTDIKDRAHQLWNASDDSQETLAEAVGRSQAAVSKALRSVDESEMRYVKICVDVIEHYCDDVTIHYPRGRVERSS